MLRHPYDTPTFKITYCKALCLVSNVQCIYVMPFAAILTAAIALYYSIAAYVVQKIRHSMLFVKKYETFHINT